MNDAMVNANTGPAAVTTDPAARHGPDDARVDAGVDLLLQPRDQQQVVTDPSRNLPPVASCNSHAAAAVTNGLRRNATATPVNNSNPGAACDATAALRYAVRPVSANSQPRKRRNSTRGPGRRSCLRTAESSSRRPARPDRETPTRRTAG